VLAVTAALAVSLASLPATALANERSPMPTTLSLRASVERIAAAETDRLVRHAVKIEQTQSGQTANARLERGSFFKSPLGVAVIAAFGVGLGYALYSASNDRIRSEGR
jgi:hypothetical protein